MGRKPVGKVAMITAERPLLYMQRLKDKAAANGKRSGHSKSSLTKRHDARWRQWA
jgi:hypothetical protein